MNVVFQGEPHDAQITVVLTDATGRQLTPLYKGSASSLTRFDLPNVAPGLYLLRITGLEGGPRTQRLMIAD